MVIALNFNYARSFSEGMAAVMIGKKYGYIDKIGTIVIQPKFDLAYDFSEGMDRVQFRGEDIFDSKYGYINKKGELIIDALFYTASDFSEGLAYVLIKGSMPKNLVIMDGKDVSSDIVLKGVIEQTALAKKGFIDKKGKFAIELGQFCFFANDEDLEAKPFSEGLCAIKAGGCGFIDKTGKMIIQPQPQFYKVKNFSEGLAPVKVGGTVTESIIIEGYKTPVRSGGSWSYIDRTGKVVIQSEDSSWIPPLPSEGLLAVKIGTRIGYCDYSGKLAIEPQFDWGGNFSEGFSAVLIDKKYGFIDKKGKMVIEPKFDKAEKFSEGLAAVKIGEKWRYIDKTGKFAW